MIEALRNIKIKTLGRLASVAVLLLMIAVAAVSVMTSAEVRGLGARWEGFHRVAAAKMRIMGELRDALGYGGFIHGFKDFALSLERARIIDMHARLRDVTVALANYRALGLSVREEASILTLEGVLDDFRMAVARAERMAIAGSSAREISALMQVDDRPALDALQVLDAELLAYDQAQRDAVSASVDRAMGMLTVGGLGFDIALLCLLLALLWINNRRVLAPLLVLGRSMASLADGRYDVTIPYAGRQDELGAMARSVDVLKSHVIGRNMAEEDIARRNQNLAFLNALVARANAAMSAEELLQLGIDQICELTGWPVGHVFEGAWDDGVTLRSTKIWHIKNVRRFGRIRDISENLNILPGDDLPGQVFASGEPVQILDVATAANLARGEVLAELGLAAAAAFPIVSGDRTVAVMEFFAEDLQDADASLMAVVAQVGFQIGQLLKRKQTESALRDSEQRIRAVMETVADGIITINSDGIVESFNSAAAGIFGYQSGEVIGRNVSILMGADDAQAHDRYIADFLATGEAKIIGRSREVTGRRKDGTAFPLSLSVGQMTVGGARMFTGIVRDISHQKQTQEALRDSAQRTQAIMETAADGIITINGVGTVETFNRAASAMFGYRPSEVIGRNVSMLMGRDDADAHDNHIRRYLTTGEAKIIGSSRELTGRRKDGSSFPIALSIGEMTIDGVRMFTGIVRDMSDQKAAQEQLRNSLKMTALGEMAGGIAHEFNNLLTSIRGFTRMAQKKPDDTARVMSCLEEVDEASGRAADLTRQMLVFSNKQLVEPQIRRSGAAIGSVENLLRVVLTGQIALEVEGTDCESLVKIDPAVLSQAFVDLAINSQDAMPDGGRILIRCEAIEVAQEFVASHGDRVLPGDYVRITVADEGEGVAPEAFEHIFEPFFSTKGRGAGTGLGLSTVYGMVHNAGGAIHVETEPGQGTVVSIYLPVVDGPCAAAPDAMEEPPCAAGSQTGTVLLAEDDSQVRAFAKAILEDQGYTVIASADGRAAKAAGDRHLDEIGVLVTDVVMPGMDGIELAKSLLAAKPELKVIYMSGYAPELSKRLAELDEEIALLRKPFEPDDLGKMVRRALST